MAIGTYAELAAAVTAFSSRSDQSANIDVFIALAEEAIYNGIGEIRPLRVSGMVTSTTAGLPTVPSDFLQAIRLVASATGTGSPVEYLPIQNLAALTGNSFAASDTLYFSVVGDQIETSPTATSYTLHYYKRFAALSGSAPTNYILTNAPGIYLHGCLMALYRLARDTPGEQASMASFGASMTALKNRDYAAKYSGSSIRVRAN